MKTELLPDTKLEVLAYKNGKIYSRIMNLTQWKELKKKPNTIYRAYQIGFNTTKNKIKL